MFAFFRHAVNQLYEEEDSEIGSSDDSDEDSDPEKGVEEVDEAG